VLSWSNTSGYSWTRKVFQEQARPLLDVSSFTTVNSVSYVLVTTDKGEVFMVQFSMLISCKLHPNILCWTKVFSSSGGYRLNGVFVHHSGLAFAVGKNCAIYSSSNATATPFTSWNLKLLNSSSSAPSLSSLNSFDGKSIVAVGSGGTILFSDDSGLTWTMKASGTTEDLFGVSYGSTSVAMIVGVIYFSFTYMNIMYSNTLYYFDFRLLTLPHGQWMEE
jgi:hypothetical protein